MKPYTITFLSLVGFSDKMLKEYEDAINEGLKDKDVRVQLVRGELV